MCIAVHARPTAWWELACLEQAFRAWHDMRRFSVVLVIIISCLQQRSSIAQLDPPFLRCRLCLVSPRNVCCSSWYGSDRIGCAAHTVFVLTVAPQMFRCRGGSLSRAHSVGRPPCTRWMSYFFRLLWVASHWFCHFVTRASAGLHRRGWEVETKLLRECKRLFTGWWWWRLCRWSVSCLVRSFWQWTLRRISGGAMPDST